jgi:hypothetical protein
VNKALEQFDVVFVTGDKSAEVLQPADGPLDFPAPAVAAKAALVLRGGLCPLSPVRADEFDTPLRKPLSQGIAVGRHVIDQSLRAMTQLPAIEQRFDQSDLVRTCPFRQPQGPIFPAQRDGWLLTIGHRLGRILGLPHVRQELPQFLPWRHPDLRQHAREIALRVDPVTLGAGD